MKAPLSLVDTKNISDSGMAYQFVMCHVYAIGMKFHFPKQYKYVTKYLLIYLINYYNFVYTVILVLCIMCLIAVNANVSSDMTFTPISIFGSISTGLMDLFY